MSYFSCACHGLERMLSAGAVAPDGGRPFALPGDAPQWGRARPFAIESLLLRVGLDLDARAVEGECELVVRRIDAAAREIALDAVDFELGSVELSRGEGEPFGRVLSAFDAVGCGPGELVYFVTQYEATLAFPDRPLVPTDAAIIGIVDRVDESAAYVLGPNGGGDVGKAGA